MGQRISECGLLCSALHVNTKRVKYRTVSERRTLQFSGGVRTPICGEGVGGRYRFAIHRFYHYMLSVMASTDSSKPVSYSLSVGIRARITAFELLKKNFQFLLKSYAAKTVEIADYNKATCCLLCIYLLLLVDASCRHGHVTTRPASSWCLLTDTKWHLCTHNNTHVSSS